MGKRFAVKKDGKWQTVFKLAPNKWGNEQLSVNLVAFNELLRSGSEWANLSIYEDNDEAKSPLEPAKPKQQSSQSLEREEIPF